MLKGRQYDVDLLMLSLIIVWGEFRKCSPLKTPEVLRLLQQFKLVHRLSPTVHTAHAGRIFRRRLLSGAEGRMSGDCREWPGAANSANFG